MCVSISFCSLSFLSIQPRSVKNYISFASTQQNFSLCAHQVHPSLFRSLFCFSLWAVAYQLIVWCIIYCLNIVCKVCRNLFRFDVYMRLSYLYPCSIVLHYLHTSVLHCHTNTNTSLPCWCLVLLVLVVSIATKFPEKHFVVW